MLQPSRIYVGESVNVFQRGTYGCALIDCALTCVYNIPYSGKLSQIDRKGAFHEKTFAGC